MKVWRFSTKKTSYTFKTWLYSNSYCRGLQQMTEVVNKLPDDVRGLVMSIITHVDVCVSHLSVQDDWTWESISGNGKKTCNFKSVCSFEFCWTQIYIFLICARRWWTFWRMFLFRSLWVQGSSFWPYRRRRLQTVIRSYKKLRLYVFINSFGALFED